MQREIKFRAIISSDTTILFTLEDLVNPAPLFSIRELLIPWLRAGNIPDRYTGRKDKNGKGIYEGDIVKLGGWWYAAGPAGYNKPEVLVKWDEGDCGFHPFANYDTDCGVQHNPDECEVIGNIYENPELLETE